MPPPTCVAVKCYHTYKTCNLHRFPRDARRKRKWEINLKRDDFNAKLYHRICSCHFEDDQFKRDTRLKKQLLKSALPTRFPTHRVLILPPNTIKKDGSSVGATIQLLPSFDSKLNSVVYNTVQDKPNPLHKSSIIVLNNIESGGSQKMQETSRKQTSKKQKQVSAGVPNNLDCTEMDIVDASDFLTLDWARSTSPSNLSSVSRINEVNGSQVFSIISSEGSNDPVLTETSSGVIPPSEVDAYTSNERNMPSTANGCKNLPLQLQNENDYLHLKNSLKKRNGSRSSLFEKFNPEEVSKLRSWAQQGHFLGNTLFV